MMSTLGNSILVFAVLVAGCTDTAEPELGETMSDLDLSQFVLPSLTASERAAIVGKYDALDPGNKIPRGLLEDAIVYYDMNIAVIPKSKHFVVVDLSLYSGKDRYWLVDTTTGSVEWHKVAHGDGSDPDNNGYATLFSNVDGSHRSSLGFYLTGEIYDGTHAHSMRLDGLSVTGSPNGMANTNARSRLIVMHEASYVDDANTSQQGRSNGCLALDPSVEVAMVDRIFGGSLIYVATSPLAPPVGRGGARDPMTDPPADDPAPGADDDLEADTSAGCAAGGAGRTGAGFVLALALVGLRRRRRCR